MCESVPDPDQAYGGQSNRGARKMSSLKYQRLSATIVVCHTKEVIFSMSKSGYYCWSNYAIFSGNNHSLKALSIISSENV